MACLGSAGWPASHGASWGCSHEQLTWLEHLKRGTYKMAPWPVVSAGVVASLSLSVPLRAPLNLVVSPYDLFVVQLDFFQVPKLSEEPFLKL